MNIEDFSKRRKSFQKKMSRNSIAIFISPPLQNRNSDVDYRYRQSSDLYYLTGFTEEKSALVITPEDCKLYLQKRDPVMEIWNGYQMGVKRAPKLIGIKKAYDIKELYTHLQKLVNNKCIVYYSAGQNPVNDQTIIPMIYKIFSQSRKGNYRPKSITLPATILHEMRLFKDKEEIKLLQKSAKITAKAHNLIIKNSHPGMFAYELESQIIQVFREHNAVEAYPSIVAPGKEACILHYTQNDAQLKKNDLVLVDAGAEFKFLATDVTRTFPVQKKFPAAARDLYAVVLKAQEKAISLSKKGNTLPSIHKKTIQILTQGLMDLKILKSSLDENIEKEKWKPYYMHQTSHWLGMDVHDVGNYYDKRQRPRKLEDGMVFTIEPGLYISKNNKQVPKHFRGIGIRIEDNILIQNGLPVNLTAGIAKSINEIEDLKRS